MDIFREILGESPAEGLLAALCVAAMAWSLYLLAWHRHGPARLLVLASGLLGFSASLPRFQAIGLWSRTVDPRLAGIANVSALMICLAALWILSQGTGALSRPATPPVQPIQYKESVLFDRVECVASRSRRTQLAPSAWRDGNSPVIHWNTDRRQRFRAPLVGDVSVEVLAPVQMQVSGHAADFSGDGIGLRLESAIPVRGIAVVRAGETLLLGQVAYCRREETGEYRAGLAIEHFLTEQAHRASSPEISRMSVTA